MSDFKSAVLISFTLGFISMGLLMTYVGPNSKSVVTSRKAECELTLPRNQKCIMQFVPEIKRNQ